MSSAHCSLFPWGHEVHVLPLSPASCPRFPGAEPDTRGACSAGPAGSCSRPRGRGAAAGTETPAFPCGRRLGPSAAPAAVRRGGHIFCWGGGSEPPRDSLSEGGLQEGALQLLWTHGRAAGQAPRGRGSALPTGTREAPSAPLDAFSLGWGLGQSLGGLPPRGPLTWGPRATGCCMGAEGGVHACSAHVRVWETSSVVGCPESRPEKCQAVPPQSERFES